MKRREPEYKIKMYEDLKAAGFEPEKYLNLPSKKMPRLHRGCIEGDSRAMYDCDRCNIGKYPWNLRETAGGWICVNCLELGHEWSEKPPKGWRKTEWLGRNA